MLIIDGHLDLAMNALEWNRDLQKLNGLLSARGYTETDIQQIF